METGHVQGEAAPAPIDIAKLSEKVYRLLMADVKLERSRLGGAQRRG